MALTTMAAINAALPGKPCIWQKASSSGVNGTWKSMWRDAGSPGQGVTPSSGLAGDIPTDATLGAPAFINPASGNTYLARIVASLGMSSVSIFKLAIYDRLWHNSGISSTSTLAQVVSVSDAVAVHLTRPDANGASVEAWYEVYGTMGAGTPTVTLAYTDQSGNAETTGTSGVLATTMASARTAPFLLATGDTGVRSIQTWTASATFTSGTIGLVLRRLVTHVVFPSHSQNSIDALGLGLPRIYDNACLEALFLSTSNGSAINGSFTLSLVQG